MELDVGNRRAGSSLIYCPAIVRPTLCSVPEITLLLYGAHRSLECVIQLIPLLHHFHEVRFHVAMAVLKLRQLLVHHFVPCTAVGWELAIDQ